jgi:hypothetical protein
MVNDRAKRKPVPPWARARNWWPAYTDSMFSIMDAIPTAIQTVLELFETTFADVRFADIDTKTLARAAADVQEVATVVASAQAALDSARGALQERQDALLEQVHRAIAYARVYAENDEGLIQRLNAITLPRPARRTRNDDTALVLSATQPSPRPRGRPRRPPAAEQMRVADMPTAE